ncbi:MAG: hypothetical protein MUE63_06940, partial [Xanthomonadales bacterium]|nr:hypothetical protein [Xanthomonadales bacterium]
MERVIAAAEIPAKRVAASAAEGCNTAPLNTVYHTMSKLHSGTLRLARCTGGLVFILWLMAVISTVEAQSNHDWQPPAFT